MRILIITQYFWPESFKINDLAVGLQEKGHSVEVLTGLPNYPVGKFFAGYKFTGPYTDEYQGIKIHRVPIVPRGKKRGPLLFLNYLSFMINASIMGPFLVPGKIDKIFIYQPSPITVGVPGIFMKFFKRAPCFFWVSDLWPDTLEATGVVKSSVLLRFFTFLCRIIYRSMDLVLISSKGFKDNICRLGLRESRVAYMPQWAEDVFEVSEGKDRELEAEVKKEMPQGFRIMFAGNIGTSQDFRTIIDAAELLRENDHIHWVILGNGIQRQWAEDEVLRRGLKSQVHFLGHKPLEQVPMYYKYADVMLVSLAKSKVFSLTLPAKVQSYLASGKPILASLQGEGAEVVRESSSGLVSTPENPESLAETVMQFFSMPPKELEAMGQRGKLYCQKHFSRNSIIDQLIARMKSVEGAHQGQSGHGTSSVREASREQKNSKTA